MKRTVFIGSEVFRRPAYGPGHPLAIPRVSAVIDLCRALGWFDTGEFEESPQATPEDLGRFHDPAYIEALRQADAAGEADAETHRRYGLGSGENPIFPDLFLRTSTACGGSLRAAELALEGAVAFNPAGGTHHGRRDRARGFCYFNDAVLAILALLDGGVERVFYADFDAHHGDGVQDAFIDDPRVFTVSVHEGGRWPRSGSADDRGGGNARNLPVPRGFNDSEFEYLIESAVLPLAEDFAAGAVVMVCGADALADDRLANLELSNQALWRGVAALAGLTPGTVILGGGGYNPWNVARCWTGLWGVLNGFAFPDPLPPAAETVLRRLDGHRSGADPVPEAWYTTLTDAANLGPLRASVRSLPAKVLAAANTEIPARP